MSTDKKDGLFSSSKEKPYRLTPEGFAKKKERLEYLRNVKRKEVADYIHEAKEAGDIRESSAYEDAKNDQAKVEGEILELERLLALAEIMTPDMHDEIDGPLSVRIGMQVEVESDSGAKRAFKLVETFEADPKSGLISDQSPVGKALMGHVVGDEVSVATPSGVTTYTILSIWPIYLGSIPPERSETREEQIPSINLQDVRIGDIEIQKLLQGGISRERDSLIVSPATIDVRIMEDPLTAWNLADTIRAITELYTKVWLIKQGRFEDCIEYARTGNRRFEKEANLSISRITYNSPAEIKFNLDISPKGIVEALTMAIDAVRHGAYKTKAMELDNRAKELEIRAKEREDKEKDLELDKKRIEYALAIADKIVEALRPGIDAEMKASLMESLLPNLLQLGSSRGLELVMPTDQLVKIESQQSGIQKTSI